VRRIALLLLLLLTGSLFSMACQASTLSCATDTTLLQAATSTPAQVTGTSGERLALHPYHPSYDPMRAPPPPDMYLLAGDAVEVIATCENYAYVRYQGSKLVSAGWVEKARLHVTGAPHARPPDTVAKVCAAAANIINRDDNGSFNLPRLPLAPAPEGMQDKVSQANPDSVVTNIDGSARIKIGGHAMKVFSIEDGGTCPSNYLQIWPDDLSESTAQTDAGQQFGDGQELVQVLGHPLVLQINYGDKRTFSLASIDKNGNRKTLCTATRIYTPRPRDLSGSANPVCHALVSNHVTAIPAQAAPNKTVLLPPEVREQYRPAFELSGTSKADLRNEGKPVDVGLVRFHYESGGGCGRTADATFPVLLNVHGIADLTDATNMQLVKTITGASQLDEFYLTSPGGGRLITYAGHTYFVTYAEPVIDSNPPNTALTGVVELTSTGARNVCSFQPYQFEVDPSPGLRSQIVP